MKVLSFADARIVTTDEIADGVLEYASALARARSADLVTVPVLDADGRVVPAELLIGWGSQILALPVAATDGGIGQDGTAAELRRRTASLLPPRPVLSDGFDSSPYDPDFS